VAQLFLQWGKAPLFGQLLPHPIKFLLAPINSRFYFLKHIKSISENFFRKIFITILFRIKVFGCFDWVGEEIWCGVERSCPLPVVIWNKPLDPQWESVLSYWAQYNVQPYLLCYLQDHHHLLIWYIINLINLSILKNIKYIFYSQTI